MVIFDKGLSLGWKWLDMFAEMKTAVCFDLKMSEQRAPDR